MLRVCLGHAGRIQAEFGENSRRIQGEFRLNSQRMHLLRFAACLILIVVGVGEMWADDFTGIWYIANETNHSNTDISKHWYLVPGRDPHQEHYADAYFHNQYCTTSGKGDYTGDNYGDPEKPFLTTYQTSRNLNSIWIVVSTGDGYYNIIHAKTGKYIVYEPPYQEAPNRKSMHLESTTTPGDNAKFAITGSLSGPINLRPASVNSGNQYFNPATGDGNRNNYYGPSGDYWHDGMIGLWSAAGDKSQWYLEKAGPIITFASDGKVQINSSVPSTVSSSSSIYYTTDGGTPTTDSSPYTSEFTPSENATCIKAIVVINGVTSDVSYVPVLPGSARTYLFKSMGYQSTEQDGFFMQPGDPDKNSNITVTTSSLARPLMQWYFMSAGTDNDHQYYYIVNQQGEQGDYLFCNTNGTIYMKSSDDFDSASDEYKFRILTDASDGFRIVPKAKQTVWIYKNNGNNTTDVVGTNNSTTNLQCRWDFIPVFDHKMPASLTYDSSDPTDANWPTFLSASSENPIYFKIENVGTAKQYMNDASPVGTTSTGNGALAWYIIEAGSDDWRKYYYIIHKNTGNYLKFNKEIASPQSSMQGQNDVLSLEVYDSSSSDRYQFVFAKSTVDGAYYIVPKGLEEASNSNYYALFYDASRIKSKKERATNSFKWKFVPFCANPVFAESEGNITLSCVTAGAEIHYTDDGTDPDENSTTYSSGWVSSDKVRIKTIAVIKEGSEVVSTSEIITLLNKPTVTLDSGPYTYEGTPLKPGVTVSIDETTAPTLPATYTPEYSNNINAGENTASITIIDANENDNWYIWNVPPTTFTIDKAPLTVTADDKSVTYGSAAPTYTVSYSGFMKNESVANLTTPSTATCDYTTTSNAGTYIIIPSGGAATNYAFSYVNGTLTVNPAEVTLTANSGTETYDRTEKTVSGYTCSVDDLTFVGVSASRSETNAGTYDVTFTGVTLNSTKDESGNYVVAVATPGTLTINPKTLTITPNADQYKGFGDDDPVLTYTYSGLVEGDEIAFNGALGREEGEDVGTYEINLDDLASANSNYVLALTEEPVVYFTIMKSVGNESMAEGFKLEIGEGGDIILKDGETGLEEGVDYSVGPHNYTGTNNKYDTRTVSGSGSYTGSFTFTNASVNFQTDADQVEWSATFVAEPIGGGDADDTKGHALPDGMKAFIITDIDGDWAIPEPLAYIPEGVPVLLVSDKESGGFVVENATPTDEQKINDTQKGANMLKVTTSTTHFDIKTIFLLYKNEFIYNMSGDLAAGKVYLNPPSGSSPAPSRLRIKKKDDTGIEDTHFLPLTSHLSDVWYTLDGRRLNAKPMERGLYINERKKIFIK